MLGEIDKTWTSICYTIIIKRTAGFVTDSSGLAVHCVVVTSMWLRSTKAFDMNAVIAVVIFQVAVMLISISNSHRVLIEVRDQ